MARSRATDEMISCIFIVNMISLLFAPSFSMRLNDITKHVLTTLLCNVAGTILSLALHRGWTRTGFTFRLTPYWNKLSPWFRIAIVLLLFSIFCVDFFCRVLFVSLICSFFIERYIKLSSRKALVATTNTVNNAAAENERNSPHARVLHQGTGISPVSMRVTPSVRAGTSVLPTTPFGDKILPPPSPSISSSKQNLRGRRRKQVSNDSELGKKPAANISESIKLKDDMTSHVSATGDRNNREKYGQGSAFRTHSEASVAVGIKNERSQVERKNAGYGDTTSKRKRDDNSSLVDVEQPDAKKKLSDLVDSSFRLPSLVQHVYEGISAFVNTNATNFSNDKRKRDNDSFGDQDIKRPATVHNGAPPKHLESKVSTSSKRVRPADEHNHLQVGNRDDELVMRHHKKERRVRVRGNSIHDDKFNKERDSFPTIEAVTLPQSKYLQQLQQKKEEKEKVLHNSLVVADPSIRGSVVGQFSARPSLNHRRSSSTAKSTSWQENTPDNKSEPLYKRLLNNKKENLERIEKKLEDTANQMIEQEKEKEKALANASLNALGSSTVGGVSAASATLATNGGFKFAGSSVPSSPSNENQDVKAISFKATSSAKSGDEKQLGDSSNDSTSVKALSASALNSSKDSSKGGFMFSKKSTPSAPPSNVEEKTRRESVTPPPLPQSGFSLKKPPPSPNTTSDRKVLTENATNKPVGIAFGNKSDVNAADNKGGKGGGLIIGNENRGQSQQAASKPGFTFGGSTSSSKLSFGGDSASGTNTTSTNVSSSGGKVASTFSFGKSPVPATTPQATSSVGNDSSSGGKVASNFSFGKGSVPATTPKTTSSFGSGVGIAPNESVLSSSNNSQANQKSSKPFSFGTGSAASTTALSGQGSNISSRGLPNNQNSNNISSQFSMESKFNSANGSSASSAPLSASYNSVKKASSAFSFGSNSNGKNTSASLPFGNSNSGSGQTNFQSKSSNNSSSMAFGGPSTASTAQTLPLSTSSNSFSFGAKQPIAPVANNNSFSFGSTASAAAPTGNTKGLGQGLGSRKAKGGTNKSKLRVKK